MLWVLALWLAMPTCAASRQEAAARFEALRPLFGEGKSPSTQTLDAAAEALADYLRSYGTEVSIRRWPGENFIRVDAASTQIPWLRQAVREAKDGAYTFGFSTRLIGGAMIGMYNPKFGALSLKPDYYEDLAWLADPPDDVMITLTHEQRHALQDGAVWAGVVLKDDLPWLWFISERSRDAPPPASHYGPTHVSGEIAAHMTGFRLYQAWINRGGPKDEDWARDKLHGKLKILEGLLADEERIISQARKLGFAAVAPLPKEDFPLDMELHVAREDRLFLLPSFKRLPYDPSAVYIRFNEKQMRHFLLRQGVAGAEAPLGPIFVEALRSGLYQYVEIARGAVAKAREIEAAPIVPSTANKGQ